MCDLTVVIPMYQSQNTIESCVKSLLSQGIDKIEVICVDDGSNDSTCLIVEKMIKDDSRIHLEKIGYQGVSQARNKGLSMASGQYVLFIDSDDIILPNKLNPLIKKAIKFDADILVFGGKTNHPFKTELWIRDGISTRDKKYTSFNPDVLELAGARPFPWNKLFKTEFLNNNGIFFDPDINSYGEDHLFQFLAFSKASRIIFTKERAYYYRILQPNSVTTMLADNKEKMLKMHILLMEKVFHEYDKDGFFEKEDNRTVYAECTVGFLYGDLLLMDDDVREECSKRIVKILPKSWGDASVDCYLHTRIVVIYLWSHGMHKKADTFTSLLQEKPRQTPGHMWSVFVSRIERYGISSALEHYIGKYFVKPIGKVIK